MYIENINGPEDVKKLSEDQLNVLAEEIRDALLKKLSKHCPSVSSKRVLFLRIENILSYFFCFHLVIDLRVLC